MCVYLCGNLIQLTSAIQLIHTVQTRVIQESTPHLGISICGGWAVVIHESLTTWEVSTPKPNFVQRSTVYYILLLHILYSI